MQTEKSQPEGKRITPETGLTKFLTFSVDLGVGISRSSSETNVWLFFLTFDIKNHYLSLVIVFISDIYVA